MDFKNDWLSAFYSAYPWVGQLTKMEIHFKRKGINISKHSNFFGTLFAISFYEFIINEDPIKLFFLPSWWIFLGLALLVTCLFYSIFIYNKKRVENDERTWLVIVNFVLYIIIFSSLVIGFGLLKKSSEIKVFNGIVIDQYNKGVESDIQIVYNLNGSQIYPTNKNGTFQVAINKMDIGDVLRIVVKSSNCPVKIVTCGSPSNVSTISMALREIKVNSYD